MAAGEPFGIEPYGTEAMHVLRAEKGYVIVGQDTDGSVTPARPRDGLDREPVEGRLRRTSFAPAGRRRPPGPQAARRARSRPTRGRSCRRERSSCSRTPGEIPMPLAGHVTSSYRSPALGRTFALAMLAGGHEMHGGHRLRAAARGHRPLHGDVLGRLRPGGRTT